MLLAKKRKTGFQAALKPAFWFWKISGLPSFGKNQVWDPNDNSHHLQWLTCNSELLTLWNYGKAQTYVISSRLCQYYVSIYN